MLFPLFCEYFSVFMRLNKLAFMLTPNVLRKFEINKSEVNETDVGSSGPKPTGLSEYVSFGEATFLKHSEMFGWVSCWAVLKHPFYGNSHYPLILYGVSCPLYLCHHRMWVGELSIASVPCRKWSVSLYSYFPVTEASPIFQSLIDSHIYFIYSKLMLNLPSGSSSVGRFLQKWHRRLCLVCFHFDYDAFPCLA